MFTPTATFSSFSGPDLSALQKFYGETLGLSVEMDPGMGLHLHLPGSNEVFIYEKQDHQAAAFTVLNFVVDDIDAAVDALVTSGITFARYDGMQQDEKGIARGIASDMGPDIAWFTDPAGNILAVLQHGAK